MQSLLRNFKKGKSTQINCHRFHSAALHRPNMRLWDNQDSFMTNCNMFLQHCVWLCLLHVDNVGVNRWNMPRKKQHLGSETLNEGVLTMSFWGCNFIWGRNWGWLLLTHTFGTNLAHDIQISKHKTPFPLLGNHSSYRATSHRTGVKMVHQLQFTNFDVPLNPCCRQFYMTYRCFQSMPNDEPSKSNLARPKVDTTFSLHLFPSLPMFTIIIGHLDI